MTDDIPGWNDDDSQTPGSPQKEFSPGPTPFERQTAKTKRPVWLKFALAGAAVIVAGIAYLTMHHRQMPEATSTAPESDVAEQAERPVVHDFTITDATGQKKQLADFKGNVVVLSFWASWCGPCLMELPTFAEIERKYHDRGLRVVAVNLDEGDEGNKFAPEFWKKKNLPLVPYYDPGKAVAQQFEVDTLPSNFVIDRQGRIAFSGFGANDWSSPETKSLVESLLNEAAN